MSANLGIYRRRKNKRVVEITLSRVIRLPRVNNFPFQPTSFLCILSVRMILSDFYGDLVLKRRLKYLIRSLSKGQLKIPAVKNNWISVPPKKTREFL